MEILYRGQTHRKKEIRGGGVADLLAKYGLKED